MKKIKIPFGLKGKTFTNNGIVRAHIFVTVEIATEWLKHNPKNRPMKKGLIIDLANALKVDKLKYNGDSIRFDRDGNLMDGQNRLSAIVMAKIGAYMDVVIGLDPGLFDTIDVGVKRTNRDVAAIMGFSDSAVVGGAAALTIKADEQYRKTRVAAFAVREFLDKNGEAFGRTCTAAAKMTKGSARLLSPAMCASMLWLFTKNDWDKGYNFLDALQNGANLKRGTPVYELRNFLTKSVTQGTRMESKSKAAYTIKAWNAFTKGAQIKRFTFKKGERFPEILSPENKMF